MLELPGVTHRHVEARGMRLHVAEAGPADAPPIFLTHGWPQHWWIWRHVIPALAESNRLLARDLRRLGWRDQATGGIHRAFLTTELPGLARGAYAAERLTVPTRWLAGTDDVAVKGSSLAGANANDLDVHGIDGVGHFLPAEAPEHVVQHAREL